MQTVMPRQWFPALLRPLSSVMLAFRWSGFFLVVGGGGDTAGSWLAEKGHVIFRDDPK